MKRGPLIDFREKLREQHRKPWATTQASMTNREPKAIEESRLQAMLDDANGEPLCVDDLNEHVRDLVAEVRRLQAEVAEMRRAHSY